MGLFCFQGRFGLFHHHKDALLTQNGLAGSAEQPFALHSKK